MVTQFINIFWVKLTSMLILFLIFSVFWVSRFIYWKWFSPSKKFTFIPTNIFVITWAPLIIISFLLIGLYWNQYKNIVGAMIIIWAIFGMILHGVFNLYYQKRINDKISLQFWKGMIVFWIIGLVGIVAYCIKWL